MAQFTAQAIARGLKERLDLTLVGDTYSESLDASGFPILVVTKGGEKHFVKIETIEASGHVNSLGMAQPVYAPHKATLIQEDAATGTALECRYKILAQLAKLGMKVEIFEGAGVAIAADYSAAALLGVKIAEIKAHEIFGMTASV